MDSDILKDKNKLKDFLLEDSVKEDDLSFDSSMRGIFDNTVKNVAVAWLIHCFTKYDEPTFHKRMMESYEYEGVKYMGFDFITDMKTHHKKNWFLLNKLGPKFQDILIFNDVIMLNKIVKLLDTKGWKLQEHELLCIHRSIKKFRKIIFPSVG